MTKCGCQWIASVFVSFNWANVRFDLAQSENITKHNASIDLSLLKFSLKVEVNPDKQGLFSQAVNQETGPGIQCLYTILQNLAWSVPIVKSMRVFLIVILK